MILYCYIGIVFAFFYFGFELEIVELGVLRKSRSLIVFKESETSLQTYNVYNIILSELSKWFVFMSVWFFPFSILF